MSEFWQHLLVATVVVVCAATVLRRGWRGLRGAIARARADGACGGCAGCPSDER